MTGVIQLFDVVVLTTDKPERGLFRGQVGTVVERLAPDAYEVEFADQAGKAYAFAALKASELLVLHYEPVRATG